MATMPKELAMSDNSSAHERNHNEYTYRLPAAPRIIVPPPTLGVDLPSLTVGSEPSEVFGMDFLDEFNLKDIVRENTTMEWTYERRRQAQMIIPWLYLGPMVAARDTAYLQREGITMVLAIRSQANSMMGAIKAASQVCIEVSSIEAPTMHSLIGKFGETRRIINTHIAQVRQHALEKTGQPTLGKVLVFCESGNEKSAAIVAAYLMDTFRNINHVAAMQVCQAQRFCVNFDDTLKQIMSAYWDIVQARRFVASSNAQTTEENSTRNGDAQCGSPPRLVVPVVSAKGKRSIEHTRDDDDMEMSGGMGEWDTLRFAGRDSTPFHDSY